MANWINEENMLKTLKDKMNAEMMTAAEPVIKKAVEEAEREIRRRLGAMFISIIDSSFSVDRYGHDVRILVKQEKAT